jgi:hypothetical protein
LGVKKVTWQTEFSWNSLSFCSKSNLNSYKPRGNCHFFFPGQSEKSLVNFTNKNRHCGHVVFDLFWKAMNLMFSVLVCNGLKTTYILFVDDFTKKVAEKPFSKKELKQSMIEARKNILKRVGDNLPFIFLPIKKCGSCPSAS